MFKKRTVGLFMLLFALLPPELILAASCTWVQVDVEGPPARHSPAMAYDSRREVVVLFGGFTGRERDANMYGDTWEWDGKEWRLVATEGPTPRLGHAMVYDEARGVIVLFGGNDGTFRNETWEWDGRQWRLVAQTGPTPRSRFGMAYDPGREVVVLFGGIPRDTADTWEWDGTQWQHIETEGGPSGRSRVAMAYHPERQTVILFGGRLPDGQPAGDTWEWDGTTWTLLAPSGAHARARHGMVFEPKLGTLISHGVAFAGRPETLVWTGDEWEPLFVSMATEPQNTSRRGSARESVRQPARESAERTSSRRLGPAPRIYYGMVYDAAREAIVLFGGWDGSAPLGDTLVLRCE